MKLIRLACCLMAIVLLSSCALFQRDEQYLAYEDLVLVDQGHPFPVILPVGYDNPNALRDHSIAVLVADRLSDTELGQTELADSFKNLLTNYSKIDLKGMPLEDQLIVIRAVKLVDRKDLLPEVSTFMPAVSSESTLYELNRFNRILEEMGEPKRDFTDQVCHRVEQAEIYMTTSEVVDALELVEAIEALPCAEVLGQKLVELWQQISRMPAGTFSTEKPITAESLIAGRSLEIGMQYASPDTNKPPQVLVDVVSADAYKYISQEPARIAEHPKVFLEYAWAHPDQEFDVPIPTKELTRLASYGHITLSSDATQYYLLDKLLRITGHRTWARDLRSSVDLNLVHSADDRLQLDLILGKLTEASLSDDLSKDRLGTTLAIYEAVSRNKRLCDRWWLRYCEVSGNTSLEATLGNYRIPELAEAPERSAVSVYVMASIMRACWNDQIDATLTEQTRQDLTLLAERLREDHQVGTVQFDLAIEIFKRGDRVCRHL